MSGLLKPLATAYQTVVTELCAKPLRPLQMCQRSTDVSPSETCDSARETASYHCMYTGNCSLCIAGHALYYTSVPPSAAQLPGSDIVGQLQQAYVAHTRE